MSNDAAQASRGPGATYRMLRELGSRAQPSYAAIREPNELVVVQRFVRAVRSDSGDADDATLLDAESMALLLRDARCLAKNWHPNIARVRHVDLTSKPRNVLSIASELVDGATLADLIEAAQPERTSARDPLLALPVLVRVLLDVLSGLHALHALRDGMNAPLGAMHGELCPANVVVGKDGVARIVNVLRRRPMRIGERSEAVAYAAPEALDADGSDDPRCDIYAVGAMLWEGIAGRRLYEERDPAQILARQREGELARPSIHPSSPFARLPDVAMRALSFDRSLRYRGAQEMAADLRKIAGTKLATGGTVAARVADLAGDRIRMRRAVLEPASSGTRRRASERSIVRVAPTMDRAIPVALIAASLRPPEVAEDVDVEIDVAHVDRAEHAESPARAAEPASAEHLIAAALATTTAQMRAVAIERAQSSSALPATETPGDFVIPIDATETWNEPAPPRQRSRRRSTGVVRIAGAAALVLLAMGAFLAVRARTSATDAAASVAATAPLPGVAMSPAVAIPPEPAVTEAASALASASAAASATPSSATARPAPRMVGPSAPPPTAKPKKSIYEPDGL